MEPYINVTENPIDVAKILTQVNSPKAGGIVTFFGMIRDNNEGRNVLSLEYQAYVKMAEKELLKIASIASAEWDLVNIAVVHRIGRLEVGDMAVMIAVSSAHRDSAFLACRYIIDSLKKVVPIWKKEFFEGGEEWLLGSGG
jgi:molybdopterin synthase catalytic subunit